MKRRQESKEESSETFFRKIFSFYEVSNTPIAKVDAVTISTVKNTDASWYLLFLILQWFQKSWWGITFGFYLRMKSHKLLKSNSGKKSLHDLEHILQLHFHFFLVKMKITVHLRHLIMGKFQWREEVPWYTLITEISDSSSSSQICQVNMGRFKISFLVQASQWTIWEILLEGKEMAVLSPLLSSHCSTAFMGRSYRRNLLDWCIACVVPTLALSFQHILPIFWFLQPFHMSVNVLEGVGSGMGELNLCPQKLFFIIPGMLAFVRWHLQKTAEWTCLNLCRFQHGKYYSGSLFTNEVSLPATSLPPPLTPQKKVIFHQQERENDVYFVCLFLKTVSMCIFFFFFLLILVHVMLKRNEGVTAGLQFFCRCY